MATIRTIVVGILCLHAVLCAHAQNSVRARLDSLALAQVGLKETSDNDGPQIRKFFTGSNFKCCVSWCALMMKWLHNQVGITTPTTAAASSWFPRDNVIYARGDKLRESPRSGDVIGIYSRTRGEICHVGELHDWLPGKDYCITIEGNYSDAVKKVIRKKAEIYMISSFIP